MRKIYFLSILLIIALYVVLGIVPGGDPLVYMDPASFVAVFVVAVLLLVSNFKVSDILKYYGTAFSSGKLPVAELKSALVMFKAFVKYLVLAGVSVTVYGIVSILANLSTAELLGKSLALCLLSVLYMFLYQLILAAPFVTAIEKKLAEQDS